jgi:branched-chain amino acid transport system permease protein
MTDDVVRPPVAGGQADQAGSATRAGLPLWLYRNIPWIALAVLLALLPAVFRSGTALTMMSLMGIAIIFALSYNMLLGQTGMLSFGHAVYYGLGAYLAVHGMNAIVAGRWPIPLPLVPIIGGLTGLFFGALFGWVSTKRSGTAFAMISLGLAELVGSSALILRGFFGGEEGVTTNRAKLFRMFDWSFGPQIQIYYLIAAWCILCMFVMYRLTRTPFGRMCNAVRDNAERAQFVGYNPQVVRYISFCLSGLFAGVAGALAAINFEIANAAYFAASQSGIVLLATFIGGAGFFIGPVIGAALVSYLQVMLSDLTEIWQLYFGLLFIGMVMFAPFGIAGLIMMHRQLVRRGTLMQVLPTYLVILVPLLLTVTGIVLIVELLFRLTAKSGEELVMRVLGLHLHANEMAPWIGAVVLTGAGYGLLRLTWPIVASAWARATADTEQR